MLSSSGACDHCQKKLKVFGKRRKCHHCMVVVCRACYEPHLTAKHPTAASSLSLARQRHVDALNAGDQDVHFLSPLSQQAPRDPTFRDAALGDDLLDGIEDVEVVDVDDNEDEDDEDPTTEADLALSGGRLRRPSIEDQAGQYREFLQLQQAVEHWAHKEQELRRQQRLAKQQKLVVAAAPVPDFHSTRDDQQRELFGVAYAVFVTTIIWGIYGATMALYLGVRVLTMHGAVMFVAP
ncbi:hypothetical protein P43SY_008748 [Pythium insidiosum]|uniref:Uncharacterized protein n=1 Tax=Pythium insidiosum TaxID=114742 RepID=A0AAD5LWZ8_PYTIN|nr:hypothetical protein P43SY_008748 [Pythium insidiosum]